MQLIIKIRLRINESEKQEAAKRKI